MLRRDEDGLIVWRNEGDKAQFVLETFDMPGDDRKYVIELVLDDGTVMMSKYFKSLRAALVGFTLFLPQDA